MTPVAGKRSQKGKANFKDLGQDPQRVSLSANRFVLICRSLLQSPTYLSYKSKPDARLVWNHSREYMPKEDIIQSPTNEDMQICVVGDVLLLQGYSHNHLKSTVTIT